MTPDPSPTPDLPAILDRADRLAAARAKATKGPWDVLGDGKRIGSLSEGPWICELYDSRRDLLFICLARNLAIEEDVRVLAAEVARQAELIDKLLIDSSAMDRETGHVVREVTRLAAECERLRVLLGVRATQGEDEVTR